MTGPDVNRAMDMALTMQEQMNAVRDRMADVVVVGSAAGGGVQVRVTGTGEYKSVRIDPEVYDYGRDEVEDAVLAALEDVARQLREAGERRATDMQDVIHSVTRGLLPRG